MLGDGTGKGGSEGRAGGGGWDGRGRGGRDDGVGEAGQVVGDGEGESGVIGWGRLSINEEHRSATMITGCNFVCSYARI